MKKVLTICVAVGFVFAMSGLAQAENFHYEVTPNDLADGLIFNNGQGGVPFGYDPDSVKPTGVDEMGPTGFGSSCFWSDVQGSAAGNGTDYTVIRLSPKDIFQISDVTIGDLDEISYFTKWFSNLDWQIKIYTIKQDPADPGWYGYRFNFERPDPADNDWNQYDTTTNLPVAWIRSGDGASEYPTDVYLTDLHTTYGSEEIMFIDIISSYMTDSPPGDSYLDGIMITLTNDDVATMDLGVSPDLGGGGWGTPASVINAEYKGSSDIANYLFLLFVPVGAVIAMRILRRNR